MDFYGGADQRAQWFKNAGMADPDAVPAAAPMPAAASIQSGGYGSTPNFNPYGQDAGVPGADQTFVSGPGPVMGPQRAAPMPPPMPQGPQFSGHPNGAPQAVMGNGVTTFGANGDAPASYFSVQQQASLGPSLAAQRTQGLQGYRAGLAPAGNFFNGAPQIGNSNVNNSGWSDRPPEMGQGAPRPQTPSWSSGQSYGAGRPQPRPSDIWNGGGAPQQVANLGTIGQSQPQSRSMQGGYGEGPQGPQGHQNSSYAMDQQNQYRQQSQSQMQPQQRQRNSWGGGSWGGGQHNSGGSYGNSGGSYGNASGSGGGFNSLTSAPSSQPQRGWSGGGPRRGSGNSGGGMNEPGGSGGY